MSKLNSLTLEEIEEKCNNHGWWSLDYRQVQGWEDLTLVVIEEGGGEGSGYEIELVFSLTDITGRTRYFKKWGHHISHDGTYWDGNLEEVKPQEKTVTVYE